MYWRPEHSELLELMLQPVSCLLISLFLASRYGSMSSCMSFHFFCRLVRVSKNYRSVIRACMEEMHQVASKDPVCV
jgi:hypothetical protein